MKSRGLLAAAVLLIIAGSFGAQAKKNGRGNEETTSIEQAPPVLTGDDLATTVTSHGSTIATLSNQVNEMVGQFQAMDGNVQEGEKKNADQDKILKDVQLRLQTLEDRIGLLTQQMTEMRSEGLLKPLATQRFEEFQEYSRAVEYINAKNYTKAVNDLRSFQDRRKGSPFVAYAQYWIGEAFYLQQDFEMAIAEFQKMLAKDPKSPKAPAALYKQGLAFYHIQSFADAKEFFAKVIRTYPQSIEAVQSSSQIVHINNILELKEQEEDERDAIEGNM